ncbi:PDDEXK-like family protein, partial [Phaeodactylibacter luteus]
MGVRIQKNAQGLLAKVYEEICNHRENQRIKAELYAPHFNPLDFIKMGENKVSEILAFLLSPTAKHGQGTLFLEGFLKSLDSKIPEFTLDSVEVFTEYRTLGARRIDILIKLDTFWIGIENKLFEHTSDQKDQLEDYATFLDSMGNGNFLLLYLAPIKKGIPKHSLSLKRQKELGKANQLETINYLENILPELEVFKEKCKPLKIKFFVADFKSKLEQIVMGIYSSEESDILRQTILSSNENMEAAFLIGNVLPKLKESLKKKLARQLDELRKELGLSGNGFRFSMDNLGNYYAFLNFEDGGLTYGVIRDKKDPLKRSFPALNRLQNMDWNTSEWCPIWRFLYEGIEHDFQLWRDIHTGELRNTIRLFLKD